MKPLKRLIISASAVTMVLVFLSASSTAQSIWINPTEHATHVSLEWARSDFDNWDELSFFTSAFYLSARVKASETVRVVGELPLSFFDASYDYSPKDTRENAIGNPYFGIEVGSGKHAAWGELGVRIPIAPSSDNEAVMTGFFSDYDRCEAFMPDILSINAIGNFYAQSASGIGLRVRGGPIWLINTDPDAYRDDMDLYGVYSLQAWYDYEMVRFGAAFTGRILATEKDLNVEERTTQQLGVSLIGKFEGVEPGLHFRLPIDNDLNDILDYGLGVSLTVPFQR